MAKDRIGKRKPDYLKGINVRMRASGAKSYQVRFRLGGNGSWQSETLPHEGLAVQLRRSVERNGWQWPAGWVRGKGWVQEEDPRPNGPTFNEVVADFFDAQSRRVKRGKVKPYTVHRYARDLALHLEPTFGAMAFAEITTDDVEDWVDAEQDAGAAPRSIRNRHGLLFMLMKHGQQRMRVEGRPARADNTCEATELPEVNASEARQLRFFQHGEWALFRACLNPDVHLMMDVLLSTGLRWGEVPALQVGDLSVDTEGNVVAHVVRAWGKRAPDDPAPIKVAEGETQAWKLGPPKNKRARYVVVAGDEAAQLRAAIEGLRSSAYLFVTRHGNPWRYPDFYTDRWRPARTDAMNRGLEKYATPHMLRHTCVVWSLADGVKVEVVSEMLGHASIQITYDIYGGLINLRDPAMAQAMANAMLTVVQAVTPQAPSAQEVATRRIRPGARGVPRRRAS